MAELTIHIEEPVQYKMQEFKADNDKMLQINEFLDDVFEKAKLEAEKRLKQKQKGKLDNLGLQNGTRRIGAWSNRAKSSARTLASRVFTAICNCTNTVKSAVINRS